jgi:hypothetical protein
MRLISVDQKLRESPSSCPTSEAKFMDLSKNECFPDDG